MSSADDIIPSYSFDVSIDGMSISFSKVENLVSSIEIDTIIDGGSNNAPVLLRKPKRNPDVLVLERGVYTSFSELKIAMFVVGSRVGTVNISVKRNGRTVRMFFISGGVVVRREVSPLDALDSAVLVECLQIAHTGMVEVPLPFGI